VSPPTAVGEIPPDSFLWEVNLSGIAAPEWIERFKEASGHTLAAKPAGVMFQPVAALSFVSPQERVQEWVVNIDTWIDSANARLKMETDEGVDARAQNTDANGQAVRARLKAASDMVKHL
jgi:hypothetical protein